MNRKLLLLLLTFIFSVFVSDSFAVTYYLSNAGDDSYSGTQPDSAWKTIGKLNSVTLNPGDSVLFRTGDIFRGQIDLSVSGASGQSIYFGAYGSLIHPVISGAELISSWTQHSGNIYAADFTQTVSNFFVNGKMMTSARYPNSGFFTIDSSGVNTGLYDAALNQSTDYWKGAKLKVRSSDSKYEQTEIDSFDSGWLSFVTPIYNNLGAGYGYYLDHQFSELDTVNEWYYDTAAHKIYFYSLTDPNSIVTEGSVYDYGINAANNNSFLKFEGIDFEKQVKDGGRFNGTSSNIVFEDCGFRFCHENGIFFDITSNDTISKCIIYSILGDGLSLGQLSKSVVKENNISNVGTVPGYGLNGVTEYDAIRFSGNENIISSNKIDSIGLVSIVFTGKNNFIERNLIKNGVSSMNGGSAIFIYSSDSSTLKDNFIFDTKGNIKAISNNKINSNGITINASSNFSIQNNTIVNSSSYGIYIDQNNHDHIIKGNVVYNSGIVQMYFLNGDSLNKTYGNSVTENIFYCLNPNQYSMLLDGDSLFRPGSFDFNYYCNPYDFYSIYQYPHGKYYNIKPYYLRTWMNEYGDDNNSKESLIKWKSYNVTDTLSNDLIGNGNFTNNFDGWTTQPDGNNELLLDNYVGFDGGCAKLVMVEDTPSVWAQFRSNNFNFESDKLYQISFTGKATKRINLYNDIKQGASPFKSLGYSKFFPLDTSRHDYIHVFKATQNFSPSRITFEIRYPDSLIWLDNIHLFNVNANYIDSSRLSRLIFNYSPHSVNISLGDSLYLDLDGKKVSGSYPLLPYSSYVLTLDSPLFSSNRELSVLSSLEIYPNPINTSVQKLYYMLNGVNDKANVSIQLVDILGRTFFETKSLSNSGYIKMPSDISEGFYLFKVKTTNQLFVKKILIFH